MLITSRQNQLIKKIKKLLSCNKTRKELSEYVVEGIHLAQEAVTSSGSIINMVFDADKLEGNPELKQLEKSCLENNIKVVYCNSGCYEAFSQLKSPEGVAVLLKRNERSLAELSFDGKFVVLDNIQDPGNCGAIVRTAAAAGLGAVFFCGDCADIYHPAFLRATMGAFFKIPCIAVSDNEILEKFSQNKIEIYCADSPSDNSISNFDFAEKCAIVIGSEGQGISDEFLSSGTTVSIPMKNRVESLNAACAAAILIYTAIE